MKKLLSGVAAVAVFSLSSMQGAYAREFADIYTECGLGAIIAPNNAPVAAVTNVTWDLGTTAISSDASTADTCKGGKEQTAAFIYEAYPQLEEELAQGEGEHLNALLAMAGCDSIARDGIVQSMRLDFSKSVAGDNYSSQTRYEQAEGLHNQLYQKINNDFAQSCNVG